MGVAVPCGMRLTCKDHRPERALVHPMWWIALALMALNDHVLKGAGLLPGEITGKLSDVCGMLVAPILFATVIRARSRELVALCHLAVGAVFAAIQLSPAFAALWSAIMGTFGYPWTIVCDPTDLLALPMLAVSWRVLVPRMQADAIWWRRGSQALLAAVGMFFCVATSNEDQATEGQSCEDNDGDGICAGSDCDDFDFDNICGAPTCVDDDGDGVCATFDCDDNDGQHWDDCDPVAACDGAQVIGDGAHLSTPVGSANEINGACDGEGGEVSFIYDVVGTEDEVQYISFNVASLRPHGIEIRPTCDPDGTAIACTAPDQSAVLDTLALPGSRLYVVVEAETVADHTDFELTIERAPLVCGDGELVGPEECDDGNVELGDGCDDECRIEP